MSHFVGLDLGTAGGRCVIVDEEGREVAFASRPWRYSTGEDGFAELKPGTAYAALASATQEAMAGLDPKSVAGIGITAQRTGVVLMDEHGAEIHVGPNADGRGGAAGLRMEREHGEYVYRTAGRLPVMIYAPARLAWFRENRPDMLQRARWAFSLSDWIAFRLSGIAATEPTQAAELLLYDVAEGRWSEELCSRLEVDPTLLPPVWPPGTAIGEVRPDAAADFGIGSGAAVVPAGADTQTGAVGLGVVHPGQAVVVAGTTMIDEQVSATPTIDAQRRTWTSPHAYPERFVIEAHCGESGAPIDWVVDLMGVDHAWFDRAAAHASPGAGGVCFLDPIANTAGDFSMLRIGGLTFPVPILALGRSREDVARAVLEGVAFAARDGLAVLEEVAGAPHEVVVGGGVARLSTFGGILAASLARPVRSSSVRNPSALGAATLAAAGAAAYPSVAAAVEAMHDRGRMIEPSSEWIDGTRGAYAAWRERIDRVEEAAIRMSGMMGL